MVNFYDPEDINKSQDSTLYLTINVSRKNDTVTHKAVT